MAKATLTPRQRRFVNEYLTDLNATQAAIRAGYSDKGAFVTGSQLLRNPKIAAEVDEGKSARLASLEITQQRVLQELALLAFSDVGNYEIDENGHVTLAPTAPKGSRRAISSIKRKRRTFTDAEGRTTTETETEIRLWDKPSPLKLAGRHVGLFPDRIDKPDETDKPTIILVDTTLSPTVEETVTTTTLPTAQGN